MLKTNTSDSQNLKNDKNQSYCAGNSFSLFFRNKEGVPEERPVQTLPQAYS